VLLRGLGAPGASSSLNSQGVDLEQLPRLLSPIAEDVRVVLIKLAERVVYLRSSPRRTRRCAAPRASRRSSSSRQLANRLGVSEMKWELEDFSFRFTEPELYRKIAQLSTRRGASARRTSSASSRSCIAELETMGVPR
jgi:GTP pyrophosphokinase